MPARRYSKPAAAATVAATVYIIACGGGGSPNVKLVDSGVDAPGSAACTATTSYGAATFAMQGAQTAGSGATGSNAHQETWAGALNTDTDVLQLELYAGFGGFGSGDIKPGTYQLTGAELNYMTCGVCLRIFTDVTGTGSAAKAKDDYFATGGTVTLTATSGSNFSASISNITMNHVTIDSMTFKSTPVADGCNAAIMSGTLAAPLQAAFTGEGTSWTLAHRHH